MFRKEIKVCVKIMAVVALIVDFRAQYQCIVPYCHGRIKNFCINTVSVAVKG